MNKCDYFEELLSYAVDGEISPEEAKALREHLAVCPSCQALYEAYKAMYGGESDSLVEPPKSLKTDIMRAITNSGTIYEAPVAVKKPEKKAPKKNVWIKYAAAAACLVLIIAAVPSLMRMGSAKSADMAPAAADTAAQESAVTKSAAEEASPVAAAPAEPKSVTDNALPEEMPAAVDTAKDEAAGTASDDNHCTIYIFGELPAILADFTQNDLGDGTFSISIYEDTALELIGQGYGAKYTDPNAPNVYDYTVIYNPNTE